MTPTPEPPSSVGQQLKQRREDLDLTQGALAGRLGVTVTSVSAAENDRSTISRGKRPLWEKALHLTVGTISRAYKDGTPLEPLDAPPEAPPYADMTDPVEAAVWVMDASEEVRRLLIDDHRAGKERRDQQRSA